MHIKYPIGAICLLLVASCGNQGGPVKNTGTTIIKSPKQPTSSKLAKTGTTIVMSVVGKYYGLKNALVAAKAGQADSAALQLDVITGILHRYLETDTALSSVLMPYVDTIINECRIIPSIKDETCEKQRLAFGTISSAIYGLVTNAGLKNAGIFHEYCPMAFNEKGATWLSDESEIKNPYFGKKMMECGEVTDSL